MQKATIFIQILCRILLPVAVLQSCGQRTEYARLTGYAQGGLYSVIYNCDGVTVPQNELQAGVDSILAVIDSSLSGYNKSSILSRYNAGENPQTDDVFDEMMSLAHKYKVETGGALDCAAGPLFDIWGFGFEGDSFPDSSTVFEAKSLAALEKSFNFNAIAQGYSCDLVASYLRGKGVEDMLVDIGEIYCCGVNASGNPWTIGVDSPFDGNENPGQSLQDIVFAPETGCGIVTSGNYRKFYVKDGKKYAHTIDPRTGYPVSHNLLSATIIAPTATDADAYATYCMVIGLDGARKFIESRDDLEGYLIYDDGGRMSEWHSAGFELKTE